MNKNLAESLNNILDIIEEKCTDAEGNVHVDSNHLGVFKEETDYLKIRLGLDPFQAILFALIIIVDANGRCNINNVGKRLGMSYLKMLSYSKDLYTLRDRGLIRMRGNNDLSVPPEVVDAVMEDKPFEKPSIEGMNTRAIIRRNASNLKRLEDGEINPYKFVEEVEIVLNANPQTSYAAACEKYQILSARVNPVDKAMFHIMAILYIRRDYTVFDMGDMEDFFKDGETMDTIRDFFENKSMALQILNIIEPAQCDGMRDGASFKFKDEVVSDLFADIKVKISTLKTIDLNDTAAKPMKELFYNRQERGQIERLGHLLEEESLRQKPFTSWLAGQEERLWKQMWPSSATAMWVKPRKTCVPFSMTIALPVRKMRRCQSSFSTRQMPSLAPVWKEPYVQWTEWKIASRTSSYRKWRTLRASSLLPPTCWATLTRPLSAASSSRSASTSRILNLAAAFGNPSFHNFLKPTLCP